MEYQQSPTPDTVDELLTVLADPRSRSALSYFDDRSDDVCSTRDLASEISESYSADAEQITLQLHHSVLPRLDDAGVVNYDASSHRIRYQGHPQLETLMSCIETL